MTHDVGRDARPPRAPAPERRLQEHNERWVHKVTVEAVTSVGAYECERLFGIEQGAAIQRLVERSLGGPCPCKVGVPCPLRSRD